MQKYGSAKLIMLVWSHVGDRLGFSFFFFFFVEWKYSAIQLIFSMNARTAQCAQSMLAGFHTWWVVLGGGCNSTHLFNNFNYKIVSVCRYSSVCGDEGAKTSSVGCDNFATKMTFDELWWQGHVRGRFGGVSLGERALMFDKRWCFENIWQCNRNYFEIFFDRQTTVKLCFLIG